MSLVFYLIHHKKNFLILASPVTYQTLPGREWTKLFLPRESLWVTSQLGTGISKSFFTVYFRIFIYSITFTQYHTFINRHLLRFLSISSSPVGSVGKTSLRHKTENRTWACLTASQRTTNWATLHPYWAEPHPGSPHLSRYLHWPSVSTKPVCRWLQLAQLAKGKKSRP